MNLPHYVKSLLLVIGVLWRHGHHLLELASVVVLQPFDCWIWLIDHSLNNQPYTAHFEAFASAVLRSRGSPWGPLLRRCSGALSG